VTTTAGQEQDFLSEVAQGNEAAFHTFYLRYWPQVYGTAFHLTRSPELARDLSQDIFLKVWEGRAKLRGIQKIEAYIYTLSKNLVIDYMKKKVFDPANLDALLHYFQPDTEAAHQPLEYKELEHTLQQAVGQLTGNVKQVFLLSRNERLTHEQIAARLHISVASSKTYAVRALQEIRQYLAAHEHSLVLAFFFLVQVLRR
jgi:RNA polymerase sigma factor (sigma-70 family)